MIKIENTATYGWEAAIRGMRNPMNSWHLSDSEWADDPKHPGHYFLEVGENDLSLMKKLVRAGTDHSKFMRQIIVSVDVVAPLYWWKEFDTYKVGTVANSCSTMHKIHAKPFEMDDFSHDHLLDWDEVTWGESVPKRILEAVILCLNTNRDKYLETKDKRFWWQLIQLLPSSYNQRRTITLNYAVLRNIYFARRNHKLDEWHDFCAWIETLPYSELITGGE